MSLVIEREAPWALVTGASGGLGRQFCQLLAARGYRLVITGRDTAKLGQLREEIAECELALAGDLTEKRQTEKVVELYRQALRR